MLKHLVAAAGLAMLGTSSAVAHVTLEVQEAPVAVSYKAVFRVGHGCEGKPTIKLRVQVPDGVISVKPQPKAGWMIEMVKATYAQPFDYYGTQLTEGVKEVVWTGGSLPDEYYDEFIMRTFLTPGLKPGKMLYFPVVQECTDGTVERWIEIPAEGKAADDYEMPAAGLKLLPQE